MIHTALLSYQPTREMFHAFRKAKGTWYNRDEKLHCNGSLIDKGISISAKQVTNKKRKYQAYYFACKINFKRLIESEDRIAVFSEIESDLVALKFDDLMGNLFSNCPCFYDWKVNRIDYCVNLYTPHVKKYIKLLQKSDIPAHLEIPWTDQRNRTHREGSFYLTGNSININFYDKESQVIYERLHDVKSNVTEETIRQAHNIFRLEVQCKKRTNYLKIKYDMKAKYIGYYLSDRISREVIEKSLHDVTKHADFQIKSTAINQIDSDTQWRSATKDKLKQIINDVARSTVCNVRKRYESEGKMSKSAFNRYLRELEDRNINAVTIPDKEKAKYPNGLCCIQTLLDDTMKQLSEQLPEVLMIDAEDWEYIEREISAEQ